MGWLWNVALSFFLCPVSSPSPQPIHRLTKGLRSREVEMKAARRSESIICLSIHFPRPAACAYTRLLVTERPNAASNFAQCVPDRLALVCKSPEKRSSNYFPNRMPLFIKTLSGFRMSWAQPPNNGSIPWRCFPIRSDTSHLQAEIVSDCSRMPRQSKRNYPNSTKEFDFIFCLLELPFNLPAYKITLHQLLRGKQFP